MAINGSGYWFLDPETGVETDYSPTTGEGNFGNDIVGAVLELIAPPTPTGPTGPTSPCTDCPPIEFPVANPFDCGPTPVARVTHPCEDCETEWDGGGSDWDGGMVEWACEEEEEEDDDDDDDGGGGIPM